MDFVCNGIANVLIGQWKRNIVYKDYSFLYVIMIINQQYFAIIYVYMYVFLNNVTIKLDIKNIVTKHMKLFFVQLQF